MSTFIPEIEKSTPADIRVHQNSKLIEALAYLNDNSIFYQALFEKNQIDIVKIKSVEDLSLIPTTSKDDLQKHNDDFICVGKEKIVDYITTSGTLGDPVTFAMTNADLDRLAYNEQISFGCAGLDSNDTVQLTVTNDRRFMAGKAYFLGLRKLGAASIRVGPGIPELQFDSIERFEPSTLVLVPSFILKMVEYAEAHNIDYKRSSVRKAVCIGESLRNADFSLNALGQKIKDKWDIHLYSTYASTEMGTAFTECEEGIGGHHHPEMIIVEFLDEEGKPVPEGQAGEVTITSLGVEAMPLLRFKTGDICHHHLEKCKCGRTTMRLGPVIGRKQQMIKYKGTALYPPALYDILNGIDSVQNYVVEVSTNDFGTDEILIKIGIDDPSQASIKSLKDHFRAKLRVAPEIEFHTSAEIASIQFPEMNRKPILFFDKR
ncbi:MAG: phenylacetate--CoA ligase [Bacteroidetes bacterium]|nr:MAG: phenylacetate--CoA ligase [Bacteroidota bacterium]